MASSVKAEHSVSKLTVLLYVLEIVFFFAGPLLKWPSAIDISGVLPIVAGVIAVGLGLFLVWKGNWRPGFTIPGIVLICLPLSLGVSQLLPQSATKSDAATATILSPTAIATCVNPPSDDYCQFRVSGRSTGVAGSPDRVLYVAVFPSVPPGGGWYPQRPVTVNNDGTWELLAYLGNEEHPAESGNAFSIVAIVSFQNATVDGVPLAQFTEGNYIKGPEAIRPVSPRSDIVSLTLERPHGLVQPSTPSP